MAAPIAARPKAMSIGSCASWAGWRLFARRTVVVDWLTAGPTQWAPDRPDTKDAQFGKPGPGDPSYRVLEHPFFARRA